MFCSLQPLEHCDEDFPEVFLEWPYMVIRDTDTLPVFFINTLTFSGTTEPSQRIRCDSSTQLHTQNGTDSSCIKFFLLGCLMMMWTSFQFNTFDKKKSNKTISSLNIWATSHVAAFLSYIFANVIFCGSSFRWSQNQKANSQDSTQTRWSTTKF